MSFSLKDIDRHQLENGLTLLTREDHSIPIVTSMIWYRVGSRHDQPGNTGTSHFLEHMMFKGTKRFRKGEIDYITARHGGFNNAFTSLDYTAYYFSFASDRWQSALEIEADRMCNTLFDLSEFELEKSVILEELRMEMDQPWELLRQAVLSAAFKQHPYRLPVIGFSEDVAGLKLAAVVQRYREYYLPSNATLVIVGDFDSREAIEHVHDLFGMIPGSSPPQAFTPSGSTSLEGTSLNITHPTTIPRLFLGLPSPSINDAEFYAFHLLDKLLTEGKLSRLFQRFVERERLASMVTSEIGETLDPFLLLVRVDVREQSNLGALESVFVEELNKLAEDIPTSEELERAKRQCTLQYLNDLETCADQAFNIGLYETLNRLDVLTEYCERIEAVTSEELVAAAQRYLRPDQLIVASMSPDSVTAGPF